MILRNARGDIIFDESGENPKKNEKLYWEKSQV